MEFLRLNLGYFLLFPLCTVSVLSYHLFSPADNYLIDCGSTGGTIVDNRLFVGEPSSSNSQFFSSSSTTSLRNGNPSSGFPTLYHTARVFRSPSQYAFRINEKGTHMVRLHFHAFNSSKFDLGKAQFHVLVDEYLVLSNLENGNSGNPRILEYLTMVDKEKLVITFVPTKKTNFAFVNAIEVISAPKDLVADTAKYADSEMVENFEGLTKQALEVVYRVNVGGPKVTPFNDSLWRTWVPDDPFLKSSKGLENQYFSGRIKYQVGGASREVGPDNMYNTARLIRGSYSSISNIRMTWVFPVVGRYKHLIRLHFCDIASSSLGLLYFNIYINGHLAYKFLDLSYLTGELASPFYADFVVDGDNRGSLSVGIGPSNKSMIFHGVDAILNGVEIMKLNNSYGSLDGELTAGMIMNSWPKRNMNIVVPLIAAACILLSISIVIRRRMVGSRDFVKWSRLPVDLSVANVKIDNLHKTGM